MFRFWQHGGGFDRNLWNAKAIHDAINYIEANPVRRGLASAPENYRWSSSYARVRNQGVVPDTFNMPVLMLNHHHQRIGVI
jgi:putative transposase